MPAPGVETWPGYRCGMDWLAWHDAYDRPGSPLGRRLAIVQERIRTALDECPAGPVRVVSACAGQGRDLLGVLVDHARRTDVRARLVELDPRNAAVAGRAAAAAGLTGVEVVVGDAGLTDHYRDLVPADLVLLCGVFGNIADRDIERTVGACRQLCGTGGSVIWTRHRDAPDRVPLICDWFARAGFEPSWLTEPDNDHAVGVHRFRGVPEPLEPGTRVFGFVGYDALGRG